LVGEKECVQLKNQCKNGGIDLNPLNPVSRRKTKPRRKTKARKGEGKKMNLRRREAHAQFLVRRPTCRRPAKWEDLRCEKSQAVGSRTTP